MTGALTIPDRAVADGALATAQAPYAYHLIVEAGDDLHAQLDSRNILTTANEIIDGSTYSRRQDTFGWEIDQQQGRISIFESPLPHARSERRGARDIRVGGGSYRHADISIQHNPMSTLFDTRHMIKVEDKRVDILFEGADGKPLFPLTMLFIFIEWWHNSEQKPR